MERRAVSCAEVVSSSLTLATKIKYLHEEFWLLARVRVCVREICDFFGSRGQMIQRQMAVSEHHGIARPASQLP
jgi:hypothetical protein